MPFHNFQDERNYNKVMEKEGENLKCKEMVVSGNAIEEGSRNDFAQDICKHASVKKGESLTIDRRKSNYFGHDFSPVTSFSAAAYLAMKDDFFHNEIEGHNMRLSANSYRYEQKVIKVARK